MPFKLITSTLALLLITPAAMASESLLSDDHQINSRDTQQIIFVLAEQNINATEIESWGGKIRVDTKDRSGANRVLFVDKDTLRPVEDSSAVNTQLSVGEHSIESLKSRFNDSPRSLVEESENDDGSEHD